MLMGCAQQKDYADLQERVSTQDQQLRQLQPGMADTWAQLQALRQDINTLKGQMDDLNNAGGARALVDTVNRHDAALRKIETSLALNLELNAPSAPVINSTLPTTGATSANMYPSTVPNANGLTSDTSGQIPTTPIATAPPVNTSSGTITLTPQGIQSPTQPPSTPSAPKDLATTLFETGVAAFNARQYAQAERSFADFTKTYPKDAKVGNAWYYTGECYFQTNKFSDAALAYDKVITQYPKSTQVPGAYLKQAICFSKLGQKTAATTRMQELIKKYPTSAEAARAKSFLQTNS